MEMMQPQSSCMGWHACFCSSLFCSNLQAWSLTIVMKVRSEGVVSLHKISSIVVTDCSFPKTEKFELIEY